MKIKPKQKNRNPATLFLSLSSFPFQIETLAPTLCAHVPHSMSPRPLPPPPPSPMRHPKLLLIPYSRLPRSKANQTPRRGLDRVGSRWRRRSQVRRLSARSQGWACPWTCEVSRTQSRTCPTRTSHGEWWDRGASRRRRMKWRLWNRLEREWRRKGEWRVREGVERELGERIWGFWLLGFYSFAGFHVLWFGGFLFFL